MATINLGKVITDQQKAVLDRVSYDSTKNELNTSVNIAPTTLRQQNANYVGNIGTFQSTGLTTTNIYSRVEEINNILYIICNIRLTNEGSSPVEFRRSDSEWIPLGTIAAKVFDLNGVAASEAVAEPTPITITHALCNKDVYALYNWQQINMIVSNRQGANNISVYFIIEDTSQTITLQAGESLTITGRVALTLI